MKSSDMACFAAFALAVLGTSDGLGYLFGRSYMEPCERGAGACMTSVECGLQRGRSLGSCAIGVCCRIEKTCLRNEVINFNNSYFVNPDDPRPGSSCSIKVEKKWVPDGICQLRLDFLEFDTVGPSHASGICQFDSFSVVGADKAPPVICGFNDRQHMYVDVRNARNIHLMMNLGLNVTARRWKIKVSQIPCRSSRLAPPDCLQYYEEPSGTIKSFNYGNTRNDSSYQLNLRYRMCFREACTTQLSQVGPFGLGDPSDNAGPADNIDKLYLDTECNDSKNPQNPSNKAFLAVDNIRFCGSKFVNVFMTRNPVSSMSFVSPIREANRDRSGPYLGFNVLFRQNCGFRGNFI